MNQNNELVLMISVVMITYGHEKFIQQAVEGVLMQQTDFAIELIIGNDCSPDNTDSIIKEIIKNHPNAAHIRYTRHEKNKGIQANFIWALSQAKGKYVAICDGDDFWIDPLKLQKQIVFLEQNPDYSMCFHNSYVADFNDVPPYTATFALYDKDTYTIYDMFGEWFIPTASALFRRTVIEKLPDWFKDSPVGDTVIFTIAADLGKVKLLPGIMSVYRHHPGGTTKSINYSFWERLLTVYDNLDKWLNKKYYRLISNRRADILYNIAQLALSEKNYSRLRRSASELIKLSIKAGIFKRKFAVIGLIAIFPKAYTKRKGI